MQGVIIGTVCGAIGGAFIGIVSYLISKHKKKG